MKDYIFFHNPKCAGSTIHTLLPGGSWHNIPTAPSSIKNMSQEQKETSKIKEYQSKPHHYTPEQHKEVGIFSDKEFLDAFKFTFVRNPFDRVVSEYHNVVDSSASDISFNEFVCLLEKVVLGKKYYKWRGVIQPNHLIPQHLYVFDKNRNILVDYIGRFEHFEENIKQIFEELGLERPEQIPKIGAASSRRDYRDYYDSEAKEIIERVYTIDLELFEYAF